MEQNTYIARTSGLKMKDYVGYALGDVGSLLVFSLVTSLLQKFYTDIFQLNPLWIMIMMIVARLWDAINDPIMGRITDTVRIGKSGRYRPWMLWMSVPLAISAILMFVKWPGLGETPDHVGTFVYATITYIFFGMCYTAVNIPYGSLAAVITTDENERNKLSIFRSVGSGIGGLPVMVIASFCYMTRIVDGEAVIGENGNIIKDMTYTPVIIGVIVLALLSLLSLYFCYKMSSERVVMPPQPKGEKGKTAKIVKALFTNRAFLSLSIAAMLLLAAQMFIQSYNLYLFSDFFGKGWMNLASTGCTYGPMVVLMFFTPKLIKKYGKKEICAIGIVLASLANFVMFAVKGMMPEAWWLFLLLCLVSGVGQTFLVLQIWSLVNDAIDDLEVKTDIREDGTSYAAFMFFRKLGQMVSAVAVNGALLAMSYKSYKGAVQTPETLSTMYTMATIIPAVLFALMALILIFWYPLNKKRTAELQVKKEKALSKLFNEEKISSEEVGDIAPEG